MPFDSFRVLFSWIPIIFSPHSDFGSFCRIQVWVSSQILSFGSILVCNKKILLLFFSIFSNFAPPPNLFSPSKMSLPKFSTKSGKSWGEREYDIRLGHSEIPYGCEGTRVRACRAGVNDSCHFVMSHGTGLVQHIRVKSHCVV